MSPLFVILAGITLALASFGYFRLFVDFADMPAWLALFAVGGLDIAAVLIGKHALTVAADGDSSAPWNAALLLLTGLGAFAQFSHALLAGQPMTIGIVSAAFPIVTVLLFEGQLRRVYRLNGRLAGRLSGPRATMDLVTWLFFSKMALRATKLAVLDRGLDSDSALTIAERQLTVEQQLASLRPNRRTLRRTYAAELSDGQVVDLTDSTPGLHVPIVRDDRDSRARLDRDDDARARLDRDVRDSREGSDRDVRDDDRILSDVRRRGDLARAVDAARGIVGDDFERVLAVVQIGLPEVSAESVRRTLNRRLTG
jgi:hypothetical protein